MKKSYIVLLLIIMMIPIFASAETVKSGKFKYMPAYEEAKEEVYYYSDDYFRQSGKVDNEHLVGMSYNLAISTFEIRGYSFSKALLEDIGFKDITAEEMEEKPTLSSIGTVIAHKEVDNSNLVVVAIRGEKYDSEWGNNFIVGESGNAKGFDDSSKKVIDRLKTYISKNNLDNVKVWIAGYSRAGAIANLMGVYINNNLDEFKTTANDLYIYTFEAPAASKDTNTYDNIYNVKSINDFIPFVYPVEWGFQNNGKEIKLGESKTLTTYIGLEEINEYKEVEMNTFYGQFFSWLTSRLSRDLYYREIEGPVSQLFDIYFSKSETDREKFLNFFMEDVKAELIDNTENFGPIKSKAWSVMGHNSDYLYESISKDIVNVMNSVRNSSNGQVISDEEYKTITESINPLLRVLGPIIIDDTNYYEGVDYDYYYTREAEDYNLTDEEMGQKYGKVDGFYQGYEDGFHGNTKDENSYGTGSEYGPDYDSAYASAYIASYLEGYQLGSSHKDDLVAKGKYDGSKDIYERGLYDGTYGGDRIDYDKDFYEEDWMTQEYIDAYNAAYKEEYNRGYDEGLKNPVEEEDDFIPLESLYHFASLIKNAKMIRQEHFPQENLKLIHNYDSYYTPYDLTEGANQTIDNGDKQEDNLTVKTSAHLEKLIEVQVDGNTLSKNDYDMRNGSTIVTLKDSFLKTLKPGVHKLTLIYTDGVVETNFNVEKSSNDNENNNENETTDMIIEVNIPNTIINATSKKVVSHVSTANNNIIINVILSLINIIFSIKLLLFVKRRLLNK